MQVQAKGAVITPREFPAVGQFVDILSDFFQEQLEDSHKQQKSAFFLC